MIKDVNQGSVWQAGPVYLRCDRSTWPVSREFSGDIPEEERRNKLYMKINLMSSVLAETMTARRLFRIMEYRRLFRIMEYSNSLLKVWGIMVRFLRGSVERSRESKKKPLTVGDYERADKMMAWFAMKDTLEMMAKQDLSTVRSGSVLGWWSSVYLK